MQRKNHPDTTVDKIDAKRQKHGSSNTDKAPCNMNMEERKMWIRDSLVYVKGVTVTDTAVICENDVAFRCFVDLLKQIDTDPMVYLETDATWYRGNQAQKNSRLYQCLNAFHRATVSPIAPSPNYSPASLRAPFVAHYANIETIFDFLTYMKQHTDYGSNGDTIGTIRFFSVAINQECQCNICI